MTNGLSSLPIPAELPPCDGPKLNLFEHHDCEIEWIERIGWTEDMGTPNEGYVFRVKINQVEYALKVFKFYNPIDDEWAWQPRMGDVSLDTAAYYNDPFYNECRAYGRIRKPLKGKRKLSDVAIPCHGFLFLSERDKEYLDDNGYSLMPKVVNRSYWSYQEQTIGGIRPRAIVKDLASDDPGITGKNLRKVFNRIVAMNQHKIYNYDIRLDNFRDGKLVDFGSAMTEPDRMLDAMDDAYYQRQMDRAMFDYMVAEEEIPNPKKIVALHPMRLRPRC
ncbi:unnamed protein product [Clonostachys rosea]|uniref:Protein kinase domain-containing protein n=1 Tax=Bionectria ochroleuca TaxID=29856 RepID=A0ABY6TRR6_BIOOC|nr:unnamed protein product [Clonostachys rosea]